jgi:cephalosporin-C deacetylase-like acetyl esterase
MYPEGPPVAQAVADLPLPRRDYAAERPVSDEVFAVFRRMYDYDPRPLEPELVSSHETEHWIRERWLINGAEDGDRIPVSVYLPLGRAGPHQTVVHFPGASSIGNRRPESGYVGRLQYIIESGRALVVPLVEGVWDREGELTTYVPDETVTYRDRVVDWSKTFSRAVDFIESRDDLDETALGYYGYSWGGMMSSVMLANEPRFKVAVLDVGGLPTHPSLPEVDPLNFAPRVTIPVLMMNGRHDHTFPLESSGRPLYERLGAPPESKRLVISETGHFVPVAQQIRESLDWLDLHLGPAD